MGGLDLVVLEFDPQGFVEGQWNCHPGAPPNHQSNARGKMSGFFSRETQGRNFKQPPALNEE